MFGDAACVSSEHGYIFLGVEQLNRLHSVVLCAHSGQEDIVAPPLKIPQKRGQNNPYLPALLLFHNGHLN